MNKYYKSFFSLIYFLLLFQNPSNLYASKLLYIYSTIVKTDSIQAVNYKILFDSFGHTTTLIKTNQITSTQLTQYDLIIMSNGTASSTIFYYWEGDAASVTAIKNSGKSIIALGAGISIFDKLSLTIGWGISSGALGSSFKIASNAGPILSSPNIINVPSDSILIITNYSGGQNFSSSNAKPDIIFFTSGPRIALAFEKNKYFYWGFYSGATDLTTVGKNLLQNIINYVLIKTDVQNPSDIKSIPNSFGLSQNYPNPFNPSTIINYKIPVSSFVSLKVYDVLGNDVATLLNEFQQAGNYTSQFSIQNSQLSSGVYFYKIQAGDFVQTKKMILIK